MSFRTCSYERELTQALRNGQWPQGCEPELRTHVDVCSNCRDLVLVTQALLCARHESEHSVVAGSPGLLWWRAQLRRRHDTAERISRPVTIAQLFAWLVIVMVGIAFVESQYHHGLRWAAWWSELMPFWPFHLLSNGAGQLDWHSILAISSFGIFSLLGVLVVYLVSERS